MFTASTGQPSEALDRIFDELGLAATPGQRTALLDYLTLLQRWNGVYNLTAIRDPGQMLVQHLGDCLTVVGPFRRECGAGTRRVLDVGSGGGLPGLVLAVMCPEVSVTCVDAVGKKAAFVTQASGELGLRNLKSVHARVEQLPPIGFHVIVSRAFASLRDFVSLTEPKLLQEGKWMAMKGKNPVDELAKLPAAVSVFHVEQLHVPGSDAERCLVWLNRNTSI